MPDPAGTYNDNGIKLNEQTVSIDNNAATPVATTYILKKGSLKRGYKRIVSSNQYDVENKQRFTKTIAQGNLTLQFVDSGDKAPKQFATFTAVDNSGASVTLIVAEVGDEFGAGEEVMCPIEVYEKKGS